MAKFNSTNTTRRSTPTPVAVQTNMAGGVSYTRPLQKEITTVVLNSMLNGEDSYYESEKDRIARIEALVSTAERDNRENDAKFLAKAMVYTRNEGRLRSVSHFLAGLLAEKVKGKEFLRPAFVKSFVRPDDMTEVVALWNTRNKGKMLPNSLRRAMKTALETKFDEYQFRKYAGTGSVVKLKDVVKMVHPSPANFEDQTIFQRVIEDKLEAIETAQTINAGKTGEDRVDAYMDQIRSGKMGYMALVKNIRNLLEGGISENDLKIWCNLVTDPGRVKKSMLLPFRFVDAWAVVSELNIDEFKKKMVKKALERAFALSAGNTNIVEDGEKIAILLDESGSMGSSGYGSKEDKKMPFYIGKTLAASMKVGLDSDRCLFYTWADTCTKRDVENMSPFDFIKNVNTRGGGTDVAAPLRELLKTKTFVDKIVIFTDMQLYSMGYGYNSGNMADQVNNYIGQYRQDINPNVKVLFWNLVGYGKGSPVDLEKTADVFEVAGFSDTMLQVIPKLWSDKDFLIKEIEAVEL